MPFKSRILEQNSSARNLPLYIIVFSINNILVFFYLTLNLSITAHTQVWGQVPQNDSFYESKDPQQVCPIRCVKAIKALFLTK